MSAHIFVFSDPGCMTFAVTPVPASSTARCRVIRLSAAFDVAYALSTALGGYSGAADEMLTMRPHPPAIIPGAKARHVRYGPTQLTESVRAHSSGSLCVIRRNGPKTPAQLIRTSALPKRRS